MFRNWITNKTKALTMNLIELLETLIGQRIGGLVDRVGEFTQPCSLAGHIVSNKVVRGLR